MAQADGALRIGIIGTDNGHAHAFAAFMNGWSEDVPMPLRSAVGGGTPAPHVHRWANTLRYLEHRAPRLLPRGRSRVTALWSSDPDDAARTARACGIDAVCTDPADVAALVDAVMVLSEAPSGHLEHARPGLERGLPTYVDKPLAGSVEDAHAMYDLAAEHAAPFFSGSGLRFSPELLAVRDQLPTLVGDVLSMYIHCPVSIALFGIHGVEVTNLFLGHDVGTVETMAGPRREVVLLTMASGATSVIDHVNIPGDPRYMGAVHGELASVQFRTADLGRNILGVVVGLEEFLLTGKPPAERDEVISLLEITLAAGQALSTGERIEVRTTTTGGRG